MEYKDFGERYHVAALTMIMDFLIVLMAAYAALHLREMYFVLDDLPFVYNYQEYCILALITSSIVIFNSMISGLYRSWRGRRFLQLISHLLVIWVITALLLFSYLFFSKLSINYSRSWICTWFVLGFSSSVFFRMLIHVFLGYIRRSGVNVKHIVVVGCPKACRQVASSLSHEPQYGFHIKKMFSIDDSVDQESLESILDYIHQDECKEVWICLPLSMGSFVQDVMHHLRHSTVNIRYVPDWSGFQLINHDVTQIADFYMFNLNCSPMTNSALQIKDIEDKIIGSLILVLVSPLMFCIGLAIKLTSPGPIFYRQERMGWNGKIFTMYKFRTMPVDAESTTGPVWSKEGDRRATRLGQLLRKTSLDEIPQLFNVLRGDMSIVGPRPERKVFVDQYKEHIPGYMKKHLVKAGMTGWAQINGWRGNTSLKKRIEYDLYYIEHWSLYLDVKIIFLTLFKGFVHKNAY